MIVDTHAHIFSAAGPFTPGARYRPGYDAKVEDWMALWSRVGVTHGVLVQPSFLGTDNSQLLTALQHHSERLRGVVVIDPSVSKPLLQQWDRIGVRGVRLNLIGITDISIFGGADWLRVFAWMADLGWHLEVQCEGERLMSLFAVLKEVPVTLVIDHFGLPDPAEKDVCRGVGAIFQEAKRRMVYVKLSAPYRLRGADAGKYAALYRDELGPERLLWGTDWPWTNHESGRSYAACPDMLHAWFASPESRDHILRRAPDALFRFTG